MFREVLGEKQGMLFVGSEDRPQSFWMKNTYIPLDIVFLDKQMKIVSIQENAVPLNLSPLPSEGPARHALEVNAGSAKKWSWKKGDQFW